MDSIKNSLSDNEVRPKRESERLYFRRRVVGAALAALSLFGLVSIARNVAPVVADQVTKNPASAFPTEADLMNHPDKYKKVIVVQSGDTAESIAKADDPGASENRLHQDENHILDQANVLHPETPDLMAGDHIHEAAK